MCDGSLESRDRPFTSRDRLIHYTVPKITKTTLIFFDVHTFSSLIKDDVDSLSKNFRKFTDTPIRNPTKTLVQTCTQDSYTYLFSHKTACHILFMA